VKEVRIAPLRDDGSAWPGRLIWLLEVNGSIWARSWKGAHAQWYERAMTTLRARVTVEEDDSGFAVDVTLRPDQDAATAAAIDAEFVRKYGDPYAQEMNVPLAAVTTIELLPASA
jgi:hypothetical protein